MPKFPKKEKEISRLAYVMIFGYAYHMDDFPNIGFERLNTLIYIYMEYKSVRAAVQQKFAATVRATCSKKARLEALKGLMKSCLKKSAVDTAASPQKLEYIGWAAKAASQPVDMPGQPGNLCCLCQRPSSISLEWKNPSGGGTVRNYIIEKRIFIDSSSGFGPWQIAGTSIENQIDLNNQPTGIGLEYRVKAVNASGLSNPSNTASAVL